jgi:aspartyl-tRNA(Asn)/glutamyl-tRNA(Gln) amidotransferase subunit C
MLYYMPDMADKSDKITKDTVRYVAHLARIELKDSQLEVLVEQLGDILEFIDKLKEVDINKVKPTSHILPLENVLREDKQHKCLPIDKFISQAPDKRKNFFSVPKVIE